MCVNVCTVQPECVCWSARVKETERLITYTGICGMQAWLTYSMSYVSNSIQFLWIACAVHTSTQSEYERHTWIHTYQRNGKNNPIFCIRCVCVFVFFYLSRFLSFFLFLSRCLYKVAEMKAARKQPQYINRSVYNGKTDISDWTCDTFMCTNEVYENEQTCFIRCRYCC